MPAVTVVIPCHDHGAYVVDALSSVLGQTLRDLEVIVVDDGSTSPLSAEGWPQAADVRVTLIRTPRRGPAAARNEGIKAGRGRYILPLDADDRIAPSYLEQAVACLERDPDLGIVYCLAEFFGSQSGPWALPPFRYPDFLVHPCIFSAALFRRADWEATGGYQTDLVHGYEDHDFWISLVALGRKVHRIDETLFHYRRTPGSLAQRITPAQQLESYLTMFRHHRGLFVENIALLFRAVIENERLSQTLHTRPVFQVFWPQQGHYSEEFSARREFAAGEWVDLWFDSPPVAAAGTGALRLDPGMQAGIFDLEYVDCLDRSSRVSRVVPSKPGIRVTGTAMRLPAAGFIRILSFGPDPQLILPPWPDLGAVQVRVRYLPAIEAAADSLERLRDRPDSSGNPT